MSKKLRVALAVCAAVFALAACANKGGQTTASGGNSPVLAVVNGTNITANDFKAEAAALSPYAASALQNPKNRQKFLKNIEDKQLIVQKALAMGMDKDRRIVSELRRLKDTLLLGEFVKKEVIDKVNITDQDAKAYFEQNKANLGSVRISHILVPTEQEANDILAKLKAGQKFSALAKKYSLDPKTKDKGGDLGWVNWAQFGSTSLKDAAFKLKPGEVSGIVQSQFGYHIMKVTDKKPARESDFAGIKDALKEQIAEKKKEDLFKSYIKELRAKAKITQNLQNLSSINLVSSAPAEAQ